VRSDELLVDSPEPELASPERPGRVRRLAAGAWHVLGGLLFLLRHASLWPLAALPAILGVVFFVVGAAVGLLSLGSVEQAFAPHYAKLPPPWALAVMLAVWTTTIAAAVAVGLALALLLSAPILDHLSRRTEELATGFSQDRSHGLPWEIAQSFKSALFFLAALPLAFAIGLLPLIGPLLEFLWAAHCLAAQQSAAPLLRRGLDGAAQRRWRREWRWECLGFGSAGLIALCVPFVAPALVVGMARLVVEIEAMAPEQIEDAPDVDSAAP
jgi:uncharacterized protein involved in cysteine biosynthesis